MEISKAAFRLAQTNPDFRRELVRLAKEHKPGDVWKTDTGFRAKSPSGNSKTFDSREKAQNYTKGKPKQSLGARLKEKFGEKGQELARFISDKKFRQKSIQAMKDRAKDIKSKLGQEISESKKMLKTFGTIMLGKEVSKEERKKAFEQGIDVVKLTLVGAASVSPIPGATPMLLGSAKVISKMFKVDFSWFPSAFRQASEPDAEQIAEKFVQVLMDGVTNLSEKELEDMASSVLR